MKSILIFSFLLALLLTIICVYMLKPEYLLGRELTIAYHHDIAKVVMAAATASGLEGGGYGRLENRMIKSGWGPEKAEVIVNSRLLSDPNADVRSMAVYLLGVTKSTDSKYIPIIINFFSDKKVHEPQNALFYFGDKIYPYLLDSLKSNDPLVRERACSALRFISKEKALPLLIDLLKNDPDKEVKLSACFGLSKFGDADVLPLFMELIRNESNEDIRRRYIVSLEYLRIPETVSCIIEIMKDPTIPKKVRMSCFPRYEGKLPMKTILELKELEKSKDKDISKWAENMLNQCGYE